MSTAKASFDQLSTQHPIIQAQDTKVNLDARGELIKIYCKNIFIGIALVEQSKEGHHITDRSKESIKVLTGATDRELSDAFKTVASLSKEQRASFIDSKLSNITLFIEQMNSNPRLKAHITRCDVDNLIDQIERMEQLNLPEDVKCRLKACRSIISAFKMDHVLLSHLKDNNAFNIRYYNEGLRDGEKRLEKVLAVLEQAEEGPVIDQLEDLHRCGKLIRQDHVRLSELKHGEVVCFERVPGQRYGPDAIVFAVVDLIGDRPALQVKNANGMMAMVPRQANMVVSRLIAS